MIAPADPARDARWPLWVGLGLAFSPIAVDLTGHFAAHPWSRYALLFPLLFARAARRDATRPPGRGGTLLIASGLALLLVAAFTGSLRWARPGPVLAALGLCQRQGLAAWPTRVLLLFAVPIPAFAVRLGERGVASAMGELGAALAGLFGGSTSLVGSAIVVGDEEWVVMNRQWLALAPLLAGLAWYAGALARAHPVRTLFASALAAALAWPIAAAGLALGVALAGAGAPGLAQAWVDDGVWLATAATGLLVAERRAAHRGDAG